MRKIFVIPRLAAGFTLVEVVLALGVVSFCLVSLLALLPIGIKFNQNSLEQTTASNISASIIADLQSTPQSSLVVASPRFALPIPVSLDDAVRHSLFLRADGTVAAASGAAPTSSVDVRADASLDPRYRVSVTFVPPMAGTRGSTQVRVMVTWPALADPDPSSLPSRFVGSVEMTTSLDRH